MYIQQLEENTAIHRLHKTYAKMGTARPAIFDPFFLYLYVLLLYSDEFQKNWEDSLNSMCDEIDACKGATELVQQIATKTNIPMAIATSSRYVGVEKKRKRCVYANKRKQKQKTCSFNVVWI